ncbi:MAG TPA: DUF2058 domain-containing protein [Steroidobacteraceae bacterium]|nr:DUF2058 domain-containing protein [Steroidobacteraceae bacterium]
MSSSLRDQLLQAGLVTAKQVQETEQRQQRHQAHERRHVPKQRRGEPTAQEREAGRRAAEKAARDAELNRRRQEQAGRKARYAEIRQLVEQHRLPRPECEDCYSFVHEGKVRRIPADAALRARLIAGEVVIVRCAGRYELVPPDIAGRVRERDPKLVVAASHSADAPGAMPADDPYKDFVVPDDLMW